MNRTKTHANPMVAKNHKNHKKCTQLRPTILHTTITTTTRPLKRHFSSKSKRSQLDSDDDTDGFEFDSLPAISRTAPPQQSQTLPKPTPPLPKSTGFMKDSSNLGNTNAEVVGTGSMGLNQDGTVSRKLSKQPAMTLDPHGNDVNEFEEFGFNDPDVISADMKKMLARKTPLTPLCNEMRQQIVVRGPLSVAEYMQFCLGHPQYGYYMQRNAIGKKGDFVTSPEISPLFSEMIGIWGVSTWMRMGRPEKLQIVELGPGRGTLMKDFIATAERFPEFYNAISVHFVENSGAMRKLQRQALGVELDVEFMHEHPGNDDTMIAKMDIDAFKAQSSDTGKKHEKVNVNLDPAVQEKKQEEIMENMTNILSQSENLKKQIQTNIEEIQLSTGEKDISKIDLKQLRPELISQLKNLEKEFATQVNEANHVAGLDSSIAMFNSALKKQDEAIFEANVHMHPMKSPQMVHKKEEFLSSFMKLSTGHFSSNDFKKLYNTLDSNGDTLGGEQPYTLRNTELDDEQGWVWTDKPSAEIEHQIQQLQKHEMKLQGDLLLLLPRVTIPSHLSPEQQQQRLDQHERYLEDLLQKDTDLATKVNEITAKLEEIKAKTESLNNQVFTTKIYDDKAHKYNKFMNLPVVCGISQAKFDAQRTKSGGLAHSQSVQKLDNDLELDHIAQSNVKKLKVGTQLDKLKKDLPVSWHWTLHDVPSTAPCLILAHEFFDALPVHQFQYTQRGWREILVDVDDTMDGNHHFRYVLAPTPTPASISFLQPALLQPGDSGEDKPLLQHQDDHQHQTQAIKLEKSAHNALQTPGSHIAKAVKLSAAIGDQKYAEGVILGLDGLPINKKQKTMITHEINAAPLSDTMATLSNPKVTTEDVQQLASIATSQIYGANDEQVGTGKIQSVGDELIIRDLDARFKRNRSIKADTSYTTGHNSMHGIDPDFEYKMSQGSNSDIQNSPYIRNKLLSSTNKIGDTYETSPASLIWAEQLALRLMKNGGAALVIDYGDNDLGHLTPKDYERDEVNAYGVDTRGSAYRDFSLQGIKAHQHADVLQEPGLVDLSAHVNFAALGAAIKKTEQLTNLLLSRPKESKDYSKALEMLKISDTVAETFEPRKLNVTRAITQSALLQQLGLEDRFETLLQNCMAEQEQVALFESVNRLVDPAQMGELFKAMTVYTDMQRPPVGWDAHITNKEYNAHAHYDEKMKIEEAMKQQAEDDFALQEYHERNKMLNQMKRESNSYEYNKETELEKRLLRAAEEAGTGGSSLIGGISSELNELDSIRGQNVSDAMAALEKLNQQRDQEVNKGFYVVDRNKYSGRD